MKKTAESKIQADCVRYFNNTYGLKHHNPRAVIFSVPNEIAMMIRGVLQSTRLPARVTDGIIATISQQLKNTGLRPGASDTIVVLPGKVLFIEFKTETGTQQEVQKEFQNTVTNLGHEYHIVRSLEQFKALIQSHV